MKIERTAADSSGLNSHIGPGGEMLPPATYELLKSIQNDYRGTLAQLEKISHVLAEGQQRLGRHLDGGGPAGHGYSNFYLAKDGDGVSINRLGQMILNMAAYPVVATETERLEIRCLGRFEVRSKAREVEHWHSVKAKSVLQYLIIRSREPVVKETITEALWPECSPRAAANNLKAAIHGLRLTLNGLFTRNQKRPCILYLQGSYQVDPDIDLWIDIEEFEKRFSRGRRLERDGRTAEAMQEYEKAEALYRGDYVADDPYTEWTMLRREALKDTYLFVLSKLADAAMDTADYESCVIYCQKILGKDQCREDAYRKLMYCYSRLGQRNRSLRWYEICRQTIQSEVDASPDRETVDLYRRLLNGEPI